MDLLKSLAAAVLLAVLFVVLIWSGTWAISFLPWPGV